MTKRILCLVLCVFACTSLLCSCSDASDSKDVSIWAANGVKPYDYSLVKNIVPGEYIGVEVNKISFGYNSDVRLDHAIAAILPEYSTYDVTDSVETGVEVTVNCKSYKNGKECDFFNKDGLTVIIDGATSFDSIGDPYLARLLGNAAEKALLSVPSDETEVIASVTVPSYWEDGEFAGEEISLHFEIVSKEKLTLLEVNDDYIAENTDNSSLSQLRSYVSAELEKSDREMQDHAYEAILWHKVQTDATVISLPDTELKRCTEEYLDYYHELADFNGCSYEEYLNREGLRESDVRKAAQDYADKKVRNEIVAFAIAADEELLMTKTEFEELALKLAEQTGYTGYDELIEINGENSVYVYLTWRKVIEYIVSNAKFI